MQLEGQGELVAYSKQRIKYVFSAHLSHYSSTLATPVALCAYLVCTWYVLWYVLDSLIACVFTIVLGWATLRFQLRVIVYNFSASH